VSAPLLGGGSNAFKNNPTETACENPNRPYLRAIDNAKKTVYFIRPDCKTWSCPPCAQRRARLWRFFASYGGDYLLDEGHRLSFCTITSHRLVKTPVAGLAVWRKAWPKLSTRWRRAAPGLQYISIGELSPVGRFHVHLITTATLDTRWYKDNGAACGVGHQAKAVPILEARECGAYITKYLTKAIAITSWPPRYRRVNTSRKWPRPKDPETPYDWMFVSNNTFRARLTLENYLRAGWQVETSLDELKENHC